MPKLMSILESRRVLLTDGGVGSMLLPYVDHDCPCPDMLNLQQPEIVIALAREYCRAGATLLQTNTFGASPVRLAEFGLEPETERINRAAVTAIRAAGTAETLIAGTVGPSGLFIEPDRTSRDAAEDNLLRQVEPLFAEGVDLLLVETLSSSAEALLAIEVARRVDPSVPVAVSFHYQVESGGCRTLTGETVAETAGRAERAGADIVGANCGNGSTAMLTIADELLAIVRRPLICRPNAGQPTDSGGRPAWPESVTDMVANLLKLIEKGVRIVGGCCGAEPAHIALLRQRLHT